jgi:hypothetical protein
MITIGKLGQPCIAIGLFWIIPERPTEPEAGGPEPKPEPEPDPSDELIEALTGLDAAALLARLRDLSEMYITDPEGLRAEILRISRGNEIVAQSAINLIRSVQDGSALDREPDEDAPRGTVIPFPSPDAPQDEPEDPSGGGDDEQ